MKPVSSDKTSLPIEYKNVPDNSCFPIKIALGIITTTGGIVTLFSIISYLPHSVSYYVGPVTFCSFVSFCVVCCTDSSKERNSPLEELDTDGSNPVISKNSKNPLKKNTNKLAPADSTFLPNEVLLKVFDYLDPKDLTRVGRVCRRWRDISSDNTLWQKHYNHLGICPPESTLALPESFKQETVDSLQLEKSIRTHEPKKTTYQIPGCVEFFYYMDHHIYICYGKSIAIIFPDHTVSKRCRIALNRFGYFKPSKKKLFCVNCNERIFFLTHIDLSNKIVPTAFLETSAMTIHFETIHFNKWPPKFEKPFAFETTEKEAFIGDTKGDITIWDLNKDYGLYTDEIPGYLKKYVENPEEAKKNHKYESDKDECGMTFDYYLDLYHFTINRPILKGHTDSIIGLQVIDNFLFSISLDDTIIQWDLTTRQRVNSFQINIRKNLSYRRPFLFLFKIAGNALFIALEKSIKKWDLTTGECLADFQMKDDCKQFHILGHLLFYAFPVKKVPTGHFLEKNGKLEEEIRYERTIEIYNMQNSECIKTLTFPDFESIDYDFQLVGSKLIVRSYAKLIFWDFNESGEEVVINIAPGNQEIINFKNFPE